MMGASTRVPGRSAFPHRLCKSQTWFMVEVTGVTFVSVDTSVRILQSMAYFIPVPTSFQLDAPSGA